MIRGTTPKHTFSLPVDSSVIRALRIIYAQGGKEVITKELSDCTLAETEATVKLSQEETLLFDSSQIVEIQMRILTTGGDALASRIRRTAVGRLLEDEVI